MRAEVFLEAAVLLVQVDDALRVADDGCQLASIADDARVLSEPLISFVQKCEARSTPGWSLAHGSMTYAWHCVLPIASTRIGLQGNHAVVGRLTYRLVSNRLLVMSLVLLVLFALATKIAFAQGAGPDSVPDYRTLGPFGARVPIWMIAQLHLFFAAFILGVPIFSVLIELIGIWTKDPRYDRLAKDFAKLLVTATALTALFGGVFLLLLTALYPKFWGYISNIFAPAFAFYGFLFFAESFTMYLYWYSWDRLKTGRKKSLHAFLGIMLNVWGTGILLVTDSWTTFMMAPSGLNEVGVLTAEAGGFWSAMQSHLWWPLNYHRLIGNVALGGAIVGAYGAFRFLGAKTDDERAHYDWMGYMGSFIAILALIPLPFLGYVLAREVYQFSQQMGITMMGGFLSWLWIIQAMLIGTIFLSINYYLWVGMERIPGGERYRAYIGPLLFVLTASFLVWATPRSIILTPDEARSLGGSTHPILGYLGVMSAKVTVVNFMILATFVSWLLYRRANREEVVTWGRWAKAAQWAAIAVAVAIVGYIGIWGYTVPADERIAANPIQVMSVLLVMFLVVGIDLALYRRARSLGPIRWGQIPNRAQYALILVAVSFTWLMGLMGYNRSAIRQDWHVWAVMQDTSTESFAPTLGEAANIIGVTVIIFWALIGFVFWISQLGDSHASEDEHEAVTVAVPAPAGGSNGADKSKIGPAKS